MNPFEAYRITSPFGWRVSPFGTEMQFHTGIDLVKEHQAPIYAFTPGEVLFAGEGLPNTGLGGYGNIVCVKDDRGHLHCYAHLDRVAVQIGDYIEKDQMVGLQGNTGKSTGSHLHYEVRKTYEPHYGWIPDRENNCFDPTQYLLEYYGLV